MTQPRTLLPFVLTLSMGATATMGMVMTMMTVTGCAPATPSSGSGGSQGASGGTTGSGGTSAGTGGSNSSGTGGASSSGGSTASGGSSSGGANASGGSGPGSGGSGSGGSGSGGSRTGGSAPNDGSVSATGGSGGPDGGTPADGGPKTSCPAGVLLCDDFESYTSGTAPNGQWRTTTKGAGAAVVDTMKAFSGTKAVHFSGSVNKDEAYIRASNASTSVFPVAANQIFVRFMMYIQRYPDASPMHVRFSWVGTEGVSSNRDGSGYTMCTYNGVAIERISSGYLRDTSQAMTQAANQNKWVCWEYEISNTEGPSSGGTGKVLPRIWREGTALTLNFSGNKDNWNPAAFDLVQFSLFAYQSDPMIAHYWFDDIAVSTSRIGCPK